MKPIPEFDKAAADRLQRFLAAPERPEGTMSYYELGGFVFALACAPEMVAPSDWLPVVFNDEDAGYRDEREARSVFEDLMAFYNRVTEQVVAGEPRLPAGCDIRKPATANFEADAPLGRWAAGFVTGHSCLDEMWDTFTPESLDEELGSSMMVLSFFTGRELAEEFRGQVEPESRQSLEEMAETVARLVPDALVEYAMLGRSIQLALAEEDAAERTPRRVEKVGRNDPCSCGSGKKYKHCCGVTH